jgi:hypothetical protein
MSGAIHDTDVRRRATLPNDTASERADGMPSSRDTHLDPAIDTEGHPWPGRTLIHTKARTVLDRPLPGLPSLDLADPAEDLQPVAGLAAAGLRTVAVRRRS